MLTNENDTDLLPADEVLRRIPVSQSTFQRWIKSGEFPAPIQMARRNFWPRQVVNAWLASKASERSVA